MVTIDDIGRIELFFSCLKYSHMKPDLELSSLATLDPWVLEERNIKGIIFDVDNTLCEYNGTGVHPSLVGIVQRLKEDYKTCILSNTDPERIKLLEGYFGMKVAFSNYKKPRSEAFWTAMELMDTKPENTAMIDDRLLTGIAGAKRLGIYTIRVAPLGRESEKLGVRIARKVEEKVFSHYSKKRIYQQPS